MEHYKTHTYYKCEKCGRQTEKLYYRYCSDDGGRFIEHRIITREYVNCAKCGALEPGYHKYCKTCGAKLPPDTKSTRR